MLKILYFAWVRERTGIAGEDLEIPEGVQTVGDLVAALRDRGDGFAEAFADGGLVRAAVNQDHVTLDHPLTDRDEVAFFPPVTGG